MMSTQNLSDVSSSGSRSNSDDELSDNKSAGKPVERSRRSRVGNTGEDWVYFVFCFTNFPYLML